MFYVKLTESEVIMSYNVPKKAILFLNICALALLVSTPLHGMKRQESGDESNNSSKKQKTISIFKAVKDGDLKAVKNAIEDNGDVNATNNVGFTPLILAAMLGYEDIVEFLIEKGANVNQANKGYTALMEAALYDNKDIAQILLKNGAKIDLQNLRGQTALMLACKAGKISIIKLLLENKAQVNLADDAGLTALIYAVQNDNAESVKLILNAQGTLVRVNLYDKTARTALSYAAEEGNLDIVELLLEKGALVNAKDNDKKTALMYAAEFGHQDVVEKLCENNDEINAIDKQEITALMYAAIDGHENIVRFLMDKASAKMSVSQFVLTAQAMQQQNKVNYEIIKLLRSHDINIDKARDENGKTLLMLACINQKATKGDIELLLALGSDVNATDKMGTTPLMLAIMHLRMSKKSKKADTEIVKLLIDKGADLNNKLNQDVDFGVAGLFTIATFPKGSTPLHIAAAIRDFEVGSAVTKLLLEGSSKNNTKAEINEANSAGFTPLMYAIIARDLELVKLLLDNGAKLDKQLLKDAQVEVLKLNEDMVQLYKSKWMEIKEEESFFTNETIKLRKGSTTMHIAAIIGDLDILGVLKDQKPDLKVKNADDLTAVDVASPKVKHFLTGKIVW